jgi:hypothetical protein
MCFCECSVETQVEMVQSYGLEQQGATVVEKMSVSVEAASVAQQGPAVAAQEQQVKADPLVEQSPAYFLGASNYPGFGLMPQMPGGQYGYEQAESGGQDVSRVPSMMVGSVMVGEAVRGMWNWGRVVMVCGWVGGGLDFDVGDEVTVDDVCGV